MTNFRFFPHLNRKTSLANLTIFRISQVTAQRSAFVYISISQFEKFRSRSSFFVELSSKLNRTPKIHYFRTCRSHDNVFNSNYTSMKTWIRISRLRPYLKDKGYSNRFEYSLPPFRFTSSFQAPIPKAEKPLRIVYTGCCVSTRMTPQGLSCA